MRRLTTWSAALAIAALTLTLVSPPASADSVQTFRNRITQTWCLDDSHEPARTRTFPCNGMIYQQWEVHVWGDDTRQLKSEATDLCLDVGWETQMPITRPCDESMWQSWYVIRLLDGGIKFKNQMIGLCLSSEGGKLGRLPCEWTTASIIWD